MTDIHIYISDARLPEKAIKNNDLLEPLLVEICNVFDVDFKNIRVNFR